MNQGEEDRVAGEPDLSLFTEVISYSVLGWSLFVDTAIESNIYRVAREAMGPEVVQ